MVRKEEIVVWFSRQPSHQRLDVLCTLASICLPFELRFLNTCVDFLARRNTSAARDAEILAALEKSCPQPGEVDLQDEASRRKLIWTLSLLHAGNRIVAHTIYRILKDTCSDMRTFGPDSTPESTSKELHIIFTMVLHHPSFTFEEKVKLGEIYLCMQSRLPGLRPPSPPVPATTPNPPEVNPPSERSPSNGRSKTTGHSARRPRNSPKSSNGSPVDSITSQLKEQLGKDHQHQLPKGWKNFEHLSAAELVNCSDQEFLKYGLSPGFINHLRKLLNQCNHNGKSNGLSPEEVAKSCTGQQVSKPSAPQRPVKTCMGPPNVQPAFNNAHRSAIQTVEVHQQQLHQQQQHQQHHQQQQQQEPQSRAGSSSSSG